jgi:hypothetical protein
VFRLWRLKWRRYRNQRYFDKKFKELKKNNASNNEVGALDADQHFTMQDFEEGIDHVIGSKLLDEARLLDVDIPTRSDESVWYHSEDGTLAILTPKGRSTVRKAIDEERARRFEVRTLWVTKIVLPLAGVVVGIIGALIGLVAALKK